MDRRTKFLEETWILIAEEGYQGAELEKIVRSEMEAYDEIENYFEEQKEKCKLQQAEEKRKQLEDTVSMEKTISAVEESQILHNDTEATKAETHSHEEVCILVSHCMESNVEVMGHLRPCLIPLIPKRKRGKKKRNTFKGTRSSLLDTLTPTSSDEQNERIPPVPKWNQEKERLVAEISDSHKSDRRIGNAIPNLSNPCCSSEEEEGKPHLLKCKGRTETSTNDSSHRSDNCCNRIDSGLTGTPAINECDGNAILDDHFPFNSFKQELRQTDKGKQSGPVFSTSLDAAAYKMEVISSDLAIQVADCNGSNPQRYYPPLDLAQESPISEDTPDTGEILPDVCTEYLENETLCVQDIPVSPVHFDKEQTRMFVHRPEAITSEQGDNKSLDCIAEAKPGKCLILEDAIPPDKQSVHYCGPDFWHRYWTRHCHKEYWKFRPVEVLGTKMW